MVFKLVESAEDRWRAITGAHLVALVRSGARFENGILVVERGEAADDPQPTPTWPLPTADAADTIALQRSSSADTAWRAKSDGSPVSASPTSRSSTPCAT